MKVFRQILVVLFAAFAFSGNAADNSLPSMETILQRVIDHAKFESDNDHTFDELYSYSREKVTEFRSGDGVLKKREDKTSSHQPNPSAVPARKTASPANADADKEDNAAVSDTHSNVHGKAFKKNDFLLNPDLIKRFRFTLAGEEMLNGRQSFIVDFVPAKKDLPEHNLKDRFINKAAGRIWVDAEDYVLVKADLHLTRQVNVVWGLVGSVWKFNYSFDRDRTSDGYWFARDVNWHLEGREVVVNRIVDYHETTSNLQKTTTVAER